MRSIRTQLATLLILPALTAAPLAAQHVHATDPAEERAAILRAVEQTFEGMRRQDTTMVGAVLDSGMVLVTSRTEELNQRTFVRRATREQFLTALSKSTQPFDETISNPEIRIDQGLATVWAPYVFRLGGQVHHCGTDAIQLVKKMGRWVIIAIADTFRDTGCGK